MLIYRAIALLFQILRKRETTNRGKKKRLQRAKLGESDQAAYRQQRERLKEIKESIKEEKYQRAMKQDEAKLLRKLACVTASLVKFTKRYGLSNANLITMRFNCIQEEAMEAKHPW